MLVFCVSVATVPYIEFALAISLYDFEFDGDAIGRDEIGDGGEHSGLARSAGVALGFDVDVGQVALHEID